MCVLTFGRLMKSHGNLPSMTQISFMARRDLSRLGNSGWFRRLIGMLRFVLRGLLDPISSCGIHFENYRGRTNLETIPDGRVEWVGELPFFKFWKLSLVPELYPVYFRNSLIKTDSFRTYWKWKINQTYVFVSLCSGLKPPFFKKSNNNLEMEI